MSSLADFASSVTFGENAVNAAPALLDSDVTFTAPGAKFGDGTLTLSGLLAEDRVAIRNQGFGAGQIGIFGTNITYGGVAIGTFSGGVGDTFTVLFNSAAKPAAIDALIQNLTYANVSDTPTASRTLTLDVVDAAGAHLHTAPAAFSELTDTANPFNGLDVGLTANPTFADLDGDGDIDAVIGDESGKLRTFFNTGGVFAERTGTANPFNGLNFGTQSTPSFVDLDGDGDMDAVIGQRYGTLRTFFNAGGVFTERTGAANPFNGVDTGYQARPSFIDLDGDGDLDAVVGGRFDALSALFNTGGVFTARTGAANPVANINVGYQSAPGVVDLDGDGDLDIVVGANDGTLRSFFNTNGVFAERTGVDNPFAGIDVGSRATPSFVDVDGDGDLDVVVGAGDGTVHTFTNTAAQGAAILVNVTPESDVPTLTGLAPSVAFGENAVNAAPALLDSSVVFDGGSRGLGGGVLTVSGLLAEDRVGILNEGDGAGQIGVDGATVSYGGVAIGTVSGGSGAAFTVALNAAATTPAVDALIEHLTYANVSDTPTGTRTLTLDLVDGAGAQLNAQAATFTELTGAANPFDGIDVGTRSAPSFVDLDDDGDLDMVVGAFDGTLRTFVNANGVFSEATGAANPFDGVDVGDTAKPAFADLDGDGDLDAIVGSRAGTLRSFFNTDGAFTERTGADNPFAAVTGDTSAPSFVDLDGDGDLDLVLGGFDRILRSFFNDGNVFTERTGGANPFNGVDSGGNASPAFIDLDGDGDKDAVIGGFDGILRVYSNAGGVFTYSNTTLRDVRASFIDAGVLAAPAFVDLDGDGDLDLTLGSNDGTIRSFLNVTPHATITVNVTPENDVPTLTGFGPSVTFAENAVNAAPALLDGHVSFAAEAGVANGRLSVSGLLAEDRVGIRDEGDGAGQIGVDGATVSYGGVVIGTAAGGDGDAFTVTLNGAATVQAVDALIENLTYANVSDTPTETRTLSLDVVDAVGAHLNATLASFTPVYGADNPLGGIGTGYRSTPAFVDLDGDGDMDVVVGNTYGVLQSFFNANGVFAEATGSANPFDGVDVGYNSTVSFVDLDADGTLDAVVGNSNGVLRTFYNFDGAFTEGTGTANPFDGVDVGTNATTAFVDLDRDGDLDAVIGNGDGMLRSFITNFDGTVTEATGAANPFNGVDVGDDASPSFVDLDGDGDMDAVVGNQNGQLRSFFNTGGMFTEATGSANPFDRVNVGFFAAPSFVDLDGDGDMDIVVGNRDRVLQTYLNTTPHVTITVDVTPETDVPTLSGLVPSLTFAENAVNAAPALIDENVVFDGGSSGLAGGVLKVSGLLAEDRVGVRDQGDGMGQIGVSGTTVSYGGVAIGTISGGVGGTFRVTLNASATTQAVDALIQNLTYANASDTPTASRTLTLDVTDSVGSGLASGPQSVVIAVTPENDGPSLTGLAPAATFAENAVNAAPALLDGNVVLIDPEGNLGGGGLTISGVLVEDRIDIRNQGMAAGQIGVSGANISYGGIAFATFAGGAGAALTVTFNSAATSAAVDALIQNLTYANVSNTPTASRPLTIDVTDADGAGLAGGAHTIVVGVTPEADSTATAIGAIVFENRSGIIPAPGGATPTSVNGVALAAGDSVTLASGAIVTLNPDGSLTYDPNGKFAYLVAAATAAAIGAINGQATDRFAITLSDGSTKTVGVSIAGVGGSGDQLWFQGDHAGAHALAFDAGDLARIATLRLLSGAIGQYGDTAHNTYSYDLAFADAALAAGHTLTVDGRSLRAGETLGVDGSAETDGRFVLLGGGGDDHLTGGARADVLNGGGGADLLVGGGGNDTYVVDNAGDQIVEAVGGGVDRVVASTSYFLTVGSEIEILRAGVDTGIALGGNEFANHLIGGNGNDRLDGGTGADILAGGRGNDTYVVDDAGDRTVEQAGGGTDIVETTLSRYVLSNNLEVLRFTGIGDFNGSGNAADNRIVGGGGNDVLQGRDGDDALLGGGGADKLVGNAGADTLTGGLGADRFQFLTSGDFATGATRDRIADFSHAEGDVIDLRLIDADSGSMGDQTFRFIGAAAFDGAAGQLRAEQVGGVFLVSADTNGDGQADLTFEVVSSQPLVTADFVL